MSANKDTANRALDPSADIRIRSLHRGRPRNRFVRSSAWVLLGAAALALGSLTWNIGRLFAPADQPGLRRFLREDAMPFPLRDAGSSWNELWPWFALIWNQYGARALWATLLLATCASALAGVFALFIAPFVSGTLMAADPYVHGKDTKAKRIAGIARNLCLAMRALPEYLLGFLLLSLLSGSVWPAVIALANHNGGILGRLFGDTLEDVRPRPMQALAGAGARPAGMWLFGGAPLAFTRWLSFFFYRFETCVREATVLGMLGVISVGYYVMELRSRQFYDEMLVLVALGALLVTAADLVSGWLRERLREQ